MFRRGGRESEPPSGIEAPDKIDLVALPPDRSTIDLHIVQNLEWDGSDRVLLLLQQKVHNYVGFAADGQLRASYPEQAGLPWRIVLDCQSQMDESISDLVSALREPIRNHGGDLVVRMP